MGGLGNIPSPSSPLPHLRSVVARVELTFEILSIHGFASSSCPTEVMNQAYKYWSQSLNTVLVALVLKEFTLAKFVFRSST